MKKILFYLFLIVFLCLGVKNVSASPGIDITANPASSVGKVGDKITIQIDIEDAVYSDDIWLYISDKVVNAETLEGATPHLKARWDPPRPNSGIGYQYEWNTDAAQSQAGNHYITVLMTYHDPLVLQNPDLKVIAAENHIVYNLQANTDANTGGTGNNNGDNNTSTGDNTSGETDVSSPDSDGTVKAEFDFGRLGKVAFPPTKIKDAKSAVAVIIEWMLWLAGILALVAIIYSGVMYITAGGDTAKAEAGRKNLTWAIIGLIIVLLSIAIVNYINNIF